MKHPKGLYFLFFTEMWERFSYYGMRAIFILFMTKVLLLKDNDASVIYGSYTGLVYLTPLLGGYLCDKYLIKFLICCHNSMLEFILIKSLNFYFNPNQLLLFK
jgi:hypothetical protein